MGEEKKQTFTIKSSLLSVLISFLKLLPKEKIIQQENPYRTLTLKRHTISTLMSANTEFEEKIDKAAKIIHSAIAGLEKFRREADEQEKQELATIESENISEEEKKTKINAVREAKNKEIAAAEEDANAEIASKVKSELGLVVGVGGFLVPVSPDDDKDIVVSLEVSPHNQFLFLKNNFEALSVEIIKDETVILAIGDSLGLNEK